MFEIEHMNETFDYSLVDYDTAEFLKEREYTINGIAEDARIKIGRELKKAKNKLANHHGGVFQKWVQSGGMSIDDAYYYINLNELSRNLDNTKKDNFLNAPKSLQKEMMKKNAPEELKEQVLNGDITTHKEYKKLAEQKNQLESQLEQAQRSESIARKQLEDEQDKEPEVVERYMEPEDYEVSKNENSELKRKNSSLEQQIEYYKRKLELKQEDKVVENNSKENEITDARIQINQDNDSIEPEVRKAIRHESSADALITALEEIITIHDQEIEDYELFDKYVSTLNYKALIEAKKKIEHFIKIGGYK